MLPIELPHPAEKALAREHAHAGRALIAFCFVFLLIWIFRPRGDGIPPEAVVDRSFPPEAVAEMKSIPWYLSFRLWATILALCVIGLYIRFF